MSHILASDVIIDDIISHFFMVVCAKDNKIDKQYSFFYMLIFKRKLHGGLVPLIIWFLYIII